MTAEDVELQRPEDLRFLVPVFHTSTACAGAVTAYVLRRIAYCAGAYAPGIQEHMFHELNTTREGGSIERVQRWFGSRVSTLHDLGYRLQYRRVATPTAALLDWVRAGKGYRGAMLPTNFRRLHPEAIVEGKAKDDESFAHAVGVTVDRLEPTTEEELVMIDPWPGRNPRSTKPGAPEPVQPKDRVAVPEALEIAHRERGFHSLVYYWVGWS